MKKYKLKQSVKDKLQSITVVMIIVLFGMIGTSLISFRNHQLDQKITDTSGTYISQK